MLVGHITVALHRFYKGTLGDAYHADDQANRHNQKSANASDKRTDSSKQKAAKQAAAHAGRCR